MRCVTKPWRPPTAGGRRAASRGCAAGAVLLVLAARSGHAAVAPDAPAGLVDGTSACPEPQAVWAALSALVVIDRVERRLHAPAGGGRPIEVTDLGAAFRVRAGDRTREYEDQARDCENRAKLAAVFVALAADSAGDATVTNPAQTPPAPPPPVAAAIGEQPPAPAPRAHALQLEVGADARLGVGQRAAAPGALAQLAWDRGRLSLAAGVRGSAPVQASIGDVRVRQWRVAAQLAARVRLLRDRPVSPFLELGAVAALLSEQGADLTVARAGTAGELGIVAGAGVSFLRRRWGSTFVLVETELDPAPPTISALPAGDLGRAPHVWVGAAAGVSVGLF